VSAHFHHDERQIVADCVDVRDRHAHRYSQWLLQAEGTMADEFDDDIRPTAYSRALLQRHHICLLIERGLSDFPGRLGAAGWRQVQTELLMFDPSLRGLPLHIGELIAITRRAALENGGSVGAWNLREAVGFHAWANTLIEALERYLRDCAAVRARKRPHQPNAGNQDRREACGPPVLMLPT
jgi:hypothetical protein